MRYPQRLVSIFCLCFFVVSPCFADKGVFNPKASPKEILTDQIPAVITVTAEIGDIPQNEIAVEMIQTTLKGEVIRSLGP
ncbi:MAG: hypothetical protein HQL19_05360, partial [Candidatus Omnitrophica bacterium]|nr:hypothetical protein [Candidatus Omnitrophota bacterium]